MSKAERERRHQASLERINRVQMVVGTGDRMRVDHIGTLLERARLLGEELRSQQATELGLAAFDRLLRRVEEGGSRHGREIVEFLVAVWTNKPFALRALRGLEPALGDDMLAVLDAFRHARVNLAEQVEGGARRVAKVLGRLAAPRDLAPAGPGRVSADAAPAARSHAAGRAGA